LSQNSYINIIYQTKITHSTMMDVIGVACSTLSEHLLG